MTLFSIKQKDFRSEDVSFMCCSRETDPELDSGMNLVTTNGSLCIDVISRNFVVIFFLILFFLFLLIYYYYYYSPFYSKFPVYHICMEQIYLSEICHKCRHQTRLSSIPYLIGHLSHPYYKNIQKKNKKFKRKHTHRYFIIC